MRFIGILILSFISCIPQETFIEPELKPYYHQFLADSERFGVTLPDKGVRMYYEQLDGVMGTTIHSKKNCTIKIDSDLKQYLTEGKYNLGLEVIIFHELGHGLLNREHNTIYIDTIYTYFNKKGIARIISSYETSIMTSPPSSGIYFFWTNGLLREYYLKELFGIKK